MLRFHWRLPLWGDDSPRWAEVKDRTGFPSVEAQARFCRTAEEVGIESLLTACAWSMPDPLVLATALAARTERVTFMIAWRSSFSAPTHFVQQINTLAQLSGGRVSLNVVAGHSPAEQRYYGDTAPHDARYARTDEYLAICRGLWESDGPFSFDGRWFQVDGARLATPFSEAGRVVPRIYIGGSSSAAIELVSKRGACWLRFPEAPSEVAGSVKVVKAAGVACGLRASIVARPTREEALEYAASLVEGAEAPRHHLGSGPSDSQQFHRLDRWSPSAWATPWLWRGAVPVYGVSAMTFVGSYDEVAAGILAFRDVGVSEFIFSGWPNRDELPHFGAGVLPRVRALEAAS